VSAFVLPQQPIKRPTNQSVRPFTVSDVDLPSLGSLLPLAVYHSSATSEIFTWQVTLRSSEIFRDPSELHDLEIEIQKRTLRDRAFVSFLQFSESRLQQQTALVPSRRK